MLKLFFADLKMLARNRQSLFWSLMFPLMFTAIFGLFFGRSNNIGGSIGLINKSNSEVAQNYQKALTEAKILEIKNYDDVNIAKKNLGKNQIGAVIEIPEGFGEKKPNAPTQIKIYEDVASTQVTALVTGFSEKFFTALNYQIQNVKPNFGYAEEKTNTKTLSYFDFVLAGVLGLALMNSSIIGISVSMSKYREDKILKRIMTTPVKTWKFVLAEVLSRLTINLVQVSIILTVGVFGFNAHIYGNLFILLLMALLGGVLFQLIGFVVASFSKTADAAEGMATAITIPMMFLAGVFFPIDALPKWLYSFVQYLPLAPLLRILRGVALEAKPIWDNPINLYIVFGWIIIMLILAISRFRLTEE